MKSYSFLTYFIVKAFMQNMTAPQKKNVRELVFPHMFETEYVWAFWYYEGERTVLDIFHLVYMNILSSGAW